MITEKVVSAIIPFSHHNPHLSLLHGCVSIWRQSTNAFRFRPAVEAPGHHCQSLTGRCPEPSGGFAAAARVFSLGRAAEDSQMPPFCNAPSAACHLLPAACHRHFHPYRCGYARSQPYFEILPPRTRCNCGALFFFRRARFTIHQTLNTHPAFPPRPRAASR